MADFNNQLSAAFQQGGGHQNIQYVDQLLVYSISSVLVRILRFKFFLKKSKKWQISIS